MRPESGMLMEPVTRRARSSDLGAVLEILSSAKLPKDGVPEHFKNYFISENNEGIVGCVGLEIYSRSALLRSLAVKQEFRSRGTGSALLESAINEAKDAGLSRVVLLTETAEKFFERFGFVKIPREQAPPDSKQSVEFKTACSESAVCMIKSLSNPSTMVGF
jgi:amino-acid N-acetyltransferase